MSNPRRARIQTLFLLASVLATAPTQAVAAGNSLAERLPGGGVLFVESAGWDEVARANAATPFGQLLADPQVGQLIDHGIRAVHLAISKKAAAVGQAGLADAGFKVVKTLAHRRVALNILGVSMTDMGPSMNFVLAVDVGDGAPDFLKALESITAEYLPPPVDEDINGHTFKRYSLPFVPRIYQGVVDGVFVITAGADTLQKVLATLKGDGPTVAQDERFVAAMKKIGTDGRTTSFVLHLDTNTLLHQARGVWRAMTQTETFPPMIEAMLEATTINELRSITVASQVSQGGFQHSLYVAMPAGDTAPKWLRQAPVTDAELAMIPVDATLAKAANFRMADLYDSLMGVTAALGPEVDEQVKNAKAIIEAEIGLRIKEDILDLFDDGWVVYDAPSNGGILFTGITFIIEAKDATGVSDLFKKLTQFIDAKVGPGVVSVERTDYRDQPIHYASITGPPIPIAPAWGVHDRYVIVALHPQMVMQCMDHLAAKGNAKSILDNPDFVRGRKFMPTGASGIVYFDTKAVLEDAYRILLPLATAGCAVARKEGVPITAAMIPSRNTLTRNMYGDVMAWKCDADGLLAVSHGPLPITLPTFGSTVSSGILASIAIPSFAKQRDQTVRVSSMANVKAILTASIAYAGEHDGQFPPDLETLVAQGEITEKSLRSPRDKRDRISYIYVPGVTIKSATRTVVVYENPDIDPDGGGAAGFADGHVEWLSPAALDRALKRGHGADAGRGSSLSRAKPKSANTVPVGRLSRIAALVDACRRYAATHNDRFPPDLAALVQAELITDPWLRSPRDYEDRVSYRYVAGHGTAGSPDDIVLYEIPEIGDPERVPVGFFDGSAQWLSKADLNRLLTRTQDRLTKPGNEP